MELIDATGRPIRGDLVRRVVLRTDLTPIPATVEIEVAINETTTQAIKDGSVIKVGGQKIPFQISKPQVFADSGSEQAGRVAGTIRAIGIHAGTAALALPLQRSIIREGASWSEIYRVIGATSVVATDFAVPRFSAFIGSTPTAMIAMVLQEEAGTILLKDEKLHFRRLDELVREKAAYSMDNDRTESITSSMLERNQLPMVLTTGTDGQILVGARDAGRALVYRPRADSRILANMSKALLLRRKIKQGLSLGTNAGTRIDIQGRPYVVITAAHQWAQPGQGDESGEFTQLWLGELSQ